MESKDSPDPLRLAYCESLSIVSHDIRAPLGVILGAVTELASPSVGPLTDDQRMLVQLVRRSCEKLARLANNVAFLQRMESSRVELARQPFDVRTLVRRAAEGFEKSGEVGKLKLVLDLPESPATARVDAERAGLALVNVITNALRFARSEVRVKVTSDGRGVDVDIEDDGPGIAPAAVPGLFDREARMRASAGRSASGLGLLIVKVIADAHGGAVTAENRTSADSPSPKGARVRLTFPIA